MHSAIDTAQAEFTKIMDYLRREYGALQTGRASTQLIEGVMLDYYGTPTPLKHVATLSVAGPQEIRVSPFDRGKMGAIEKAIRDDSSLGLNPVNTGSEIIINIPPLTQERRQDIIKIVSAKAEEAKISVRQARQHAMDQIKHDEDLSEDEERRAEAELQKHVEAVNADIDEHRKAKEADILKV